MRTFSFSVFIAIFFCWQNVKVIDATSQQWSNGMPGSGAAVKYEFTIVPKQSSDILVIDRLWIGEHYFDISPVRKNGHSPVGSFNKKDTLYFSVILEMRKMAKQTETMPPPKEYKSEALIGYRVGGKKRRYVKVKKIRKLRELNLPE